MAYGIAKIRHVQEQLGVEPDASFVSAPDATVTRNVDRWLAGFGYGGRIRHGGDFVVLDIRTNCCGLYLGRLDELPDPEAVLGRIRDLQRQDAFRARTGTSWDFGKSNHFIHVLRFQQPIHGSGFGILCHGSGPELRGPGPWGPGLYHSRSPRLRELARRFQTPWGPLDLLVEPAAVQEYWDGYRAAEALSLARREALVEALFPGAVGISNLVHQGALAPNDCILGSVAESGDSLVPIALRADLPVALVRALPNLADDAVEALGFGDRMREMGLEAAVRGANLLPHGGGYALPGYHALAEVLERDGQRIFVMEVNEGEPARAYHTNFRHVPFDYRGEEVVARVESLGMGTVVNRGIPVFEFMV
jgi:hypothetical protein